MAKRESMDPRDLLNEQIAMYDGSYLKWLIHLMQQHVNGLDILFYSTNQELIREFVLNKKAISIDTISEKITNPYINSKEVVSIPLVLDFPHNSYLGLVMKMEDHTSHYFQELVNLIDALIKKEISQAILT